MDLTYDYAAFEPRTYLDEYYARLTPDTRDLIEFLAELFGDVAEGGLVLDFGGGPTLYSAIVAARRGGEIHLSDYGPANRAEVERWLSGAPEAFDWRPFIELTLQLEGLAGSEEQIRAREQAVRRCVTRVLPCDINAAPPVGGDQRYNVIISNLCLEAAARDVAHWRECVGRLAGLLQPGGLLAMAIVRRGAAYPVGPRLFPVVSLAEEDVRAALGAAGMDPASVRLTTVPSDHPEYPYDGLMLVSARARRGEPAHEAVRSHL